jgi:hypothetical protein
VKSSKSSDVIRSRVLEQVAERVAGVAGVQQCRLGRVSQNIINAAENVRDTFATT